MDKQNRSIILQSCHSKWFVVEDDNVVKKERIDWYVNSSRKLEDIFHVGN